jgi:hypothetical protein
MTDIGPEDGGETVFPKGWPPNVAEEDRLDAGVVSIVEISVSFGSSDKMANMQRCFRQALTQLRSSQSGSVLEAGSWEENLVRKYFSPVQLLSLCTHHS